jgi:hypothetical protein
MKFASRLLFLCLSSILIITVPVYVFLYYTGINTLEQQIVHRLQERSAYVMEALDRMIFERIADIQMIVNSHAIKTGDSTLINQRLIDYRNYYRSYSSLSFFDAHRV